MSTRLWVVNSELVYPFEEAMFHGAAERGGADSQLSMGLPAKALLASPLALYRNAFRMPDVFRPRGTFVVSDRVRRLLGHVQNVHFSPVTFARLFELEWRRGERSERLLNRWMELGHDSWLPVFREMEHRPDLVQRVGPYCEVLAALQVDVAPNYSGLKQVSVGHPSLPRIPILSSLTSELGLSEQMLEDYPILNVGVGLLIRDDLFQRLRPHLDPEFMAAEPQDL